MLLILRARGAQPARHVAVAPKAQIFLARGRGRAVWVSSFRQNLTILVKIDQFLTILPPEGRKTGSTAEGGSRSEPSLFWPKAKIHWPSDQAGPRGPASEVRAFLASPPRSAQYFGFFVRKIHCGGLICNPRASAHPYGAESVHQKPQSNGCYWRTRARSIYPTPVNSFGARRAQKPP